MMYDQSKKAIQWHYHKIIIQLARYRKFYNGELFNRPNHYLTMYRDVSQHMNRIFQ
jgi:hypothetical protein